MNGSNPKKLFRYLQENFNGQFYKNDVIDPSISFIESREKGESVKDGEKLTCFDNSKIGQGQSPTEVECSDGQDTCKIVATNDDLTGKVFENHPKMSHLNFGIFHQFLSY